MSQPGNTAAVCTTLRPTRGWAAIDPGELFRFRDLLYEFARRDIRLRYRQTALGIAWVLVQPLMAAGFLHFAFVTVAGIREDGTSSFLFTFSGLLVWTVFSGTLTKTSMSMVGNAFLVNRVYFPRLILPLSVTATVLIDFAVALSLFALLVATNGTAPGWAILALPLCVFFVACLALGTGLVAATLSVEYRDVQHILPIVTPLFLYASPVAYGVSQVPIEYRGLFYMLNPLAALIEAFRWSALGQPLPPWPFLLWSAVAAVGVLFGGAAIFRRAERRFADVI